MIFTLSHGIFFSLSFLFVLVAIVHSRKQSHSLEGFSVSGRQAGRYMVAGTLIGTMVGGSITLGTVQSANLFGLSAIWMIVGAALGILLLGVVYAKPLRESGEVTIGSYIRKKYGAVAGGAVSLISSLGIFFSLVASGLSGLHFVQLILPVNVLSATGILLISVLLYVLIGGIRGTGVSGIIKTVLLYGSLSMAGIVAISGLTKAVPQWYYVPNFLITTVPDQLHFADKVFSTIVGVTVTQTYGQAIFSAKNTQEAKWGCFLAAVVILPLAIPLLSIGQFMHYYEPTQEAIVSLPFFLLHYLPEWLGGLGLGAIFLSIIGSIAGLSLGAATTLTMDIGSEFCKICNQRTLFVLLRVTIVVITLGAFMLSYLYYDSEILGWNFLSFSLRGSGVFLLLLLAIAGYHNADSHYPAFVMLVSTLVACTSNVIYSVMPWSTAVSPLDLGILTSACLLLLRTFYYMVK